VAVLNSLMTVLPLHDQSWFWNRHPELHELECTELYKPYRPIGARCQYVYAPPVLGEIKVDSGQQVG
jgi:hypothetical protein